MNQNQQQEGASSHHDEAIMGLNSRVLGVTLGLLFGFGLFLATNILVLKGGSHVGAHLALLGQFFIGYTVTFKGSLIGLLYGLFFGYVSGWIVGFIYTRVVSIRGL